MKMLLLIPVTCFLILVLLLAWASYPWSLNEKILKAEVVHVEPEGMVNNEEHPAVIKVQTWNLGFLYGIGSDGSAYEPKEKSFYEEKLNRLVDEMNQILFVCKKLILIQIEVTASIRPSTLPLKRPTRMWPKQLVGILIMFLFLTYH
jgi:hypothetical protein